MVTSTFPCALAFAVLALLVFSFHKKASRYKAEAEQLKKDKSALTSSLWKTSVSLKILRENHLKNKVLDPIFVIYTSIPHEDSVLGGCLASIIPKDANLPKELLDSPYLNKNYHHLFYTIPQHRLKEVVQEIMDNSQKQNNSPSEHSETGA